MLMKLRFKRNACDQGNLNGTGVFWFANWKKCRSWSALISFLFMLCQTFYLVDGMRYTDFWCLQGFFCTWQSKVWGKVNRRKKKRIDKMESRTARKLTHILLIINMNALLHVSLRLRLWMCYKQDSQRNMKPEREVSVPSYGTLYFCIIILI